MDLSTTMKKLQLYNQKKALIGQENLVSDQLKRDLEARGALRDIQNTTASLKSIPAKKLSVSRFPYGIVHSHRPCPSCISPARIMSPSVAKCLNCNYEFCQKCFTPNQTHQHTTYHNEETSAV